VTLQWAAFEMRTGRNIADLPTLDVEYPLRRMLSNYSTAAAHLNLDGAPPNWERAVQEGASWLACWDDVDPDESILWCGYVVNGLYDATRDIVDLNLTTAEFYADRRFTGDTIHDHEGRDDIFTDTVTSRIDDGSDPGIPITVVTAPGSTNPVVLGDGDAGELIWQNTDNASVLTRWGQMIGQVGGEYTIDWHWVTFGDGARGIAATLYVADKLGTPRTPGFDPAVTFDYPGSLIAFKQVRDYSAGKGANKIVAYSSGEGGVTPYAPPVYAADLQSSGRATFEQRYQPAPSVSVDTLAQYAAKALKILAPGGRSVTMTASSVAAAVTGRQFGRDWHLGDDLGYSVAAEYLAEDGLTVRQVLAFPRGLDGVGRAIAAEISDTTISPILADAEIYQGT
jgi:hypothetical protein